MEGVENGRYRHLVFQVPDRSTAQWHSPPTGFVRIDINGSRHANGNTTCGAMEESSMTAKEIGYADSKRN